MSSTARVTGTSRPAGAETVVRSVAALATSTSPARVRMAGIRVLDATARDCFTIGRST